MLPSYVGCFGTGADGRLFRSQNGKQLNSGVFIGVSALILVL